MIIVYLHGFRGNPNTKKKTELRKMYPNARVIAPDYRPHCPVTASVALEDLNRELGNEEVIVIGTSLGGFWAKWCTHQFGWKGVLINPKNDPWNMKPGRYEQYGTGDEIRLAGFVLGRYHMFEVYSGHYEVVVALDDDVVNPYKTERLYAEMGFEVHKFETGGHRFENIERLRSIIDRSINTFVQ